MGVQIKGEFFSDNGGNWEVYIYNSGYASTVTDVIVHDLNITWESQGDDILEPLKASRAAFSFINDSSAVDTFITNLVNGNEDQFHLVIEKESNLYWAGVILADQVSWEDKGKPRIVTVTAIDGLGRLEDIYFDWADDGANPDQNTLLKYIYEALEYNGLSQYWGASDAYFKESSEIYETQMTTTGTSYSPWLLTRSDRTLYMTDEIEGERNIVRKNGATITIPDYRPMTCADVVRNLMRLMMCRIILVDGSYHIQQVRNFSASTTLTRSINKSLTVTAFASPSNRQTEGTNAKRLGDGRWAYKPPLQEVRLVSTPRWSVAQSGGGVQTLKNSTSPLVQTIEMGTMRGGSGRSISIRLGLQLKNFAGLVYGDVEIEVNVQCGTYRLKSAASTPDKIEWTTTATDRVNRKITVFELSQYTGGAIMTIDIDAPEMPFTKETGCEIDIQYTANNFSTANNSVLIQPILVKLLQNGYPYTEYQYVVENTGTLNSQVVDYGQLEITDEGDITTKNILEVYDGTNWQASADWSAGYSSNETLAKTLCLETMSLQDQAIPLIQATLKVPTDMVTASNKEVKPHLCYYYDSNSYVFNGGTMNCNRDELNGEWFEFTQNKSGLSIVSNDTDGYIYKGDDKVGLPKKGTYDPKKYNRDAMFTLINKTLANTDTAYDVSSGAITSISIDTLDRDIYEDDIIEIVHPVTLRSMDSFFLSANATSGDTSISVVSQTPAEDLPAGCLVMFDFQKTVESGGLIRGTDVVTVETTVPTSGGFGIGNVIRNPGDGNLYYSDGSSTYKLIGELVE